MPVSLSRTGPTATVAVAFDVSDLIAAVQAGSMTQAQAKIEAVRRATQMLVEATAVVSRTDQQIDADATAAAAEATRLKALRPTGAL